MNLSGSEGEGASVGKETAAANVAASAKAAPAAKVAASADAKTAPAAKAAASSADAKAAPAAKVAASAKAAPADIHSQAASLVSQMTLDEKVSLLSGDDYWHTRAVERLGVPGVMLADGPHGLRKQVDGQANLDSGQSAVATCFPPSATTACSFDRDLMYSIGKAIGEECRQEDVAVILGPGANIKRSPLGGRNFEYFSEDPFLSGEMAASWIKGVQSQNVGASLKHFCCNNQETHRMTSDSVVDERALHEIYLSGFERAIRSAAPWTVMCSYNKLNGTYMSENGALLTDVLRDSWGFAGLVVSDWGAVDDRVEGVRAGLDLEMPGTEGLRDRRAALAVQAGTLPEGAVDACATRMVELALKSGRRQKATFDRDAHHNLARRAARESAVLLKNEDGILPGDITQHAALIGAFAKSPRYQGAGSSKVNPYRLDCAYDEFVKTGIDFEYAAGFPIDSDAPDEFLIKEAVRVAEGKDVVYLFMGLPESAESEGIDRTDLALPASQVACLKRVAAVNPHIVVVLSAGSVVEVPWEDKAKALLMCYLGGEAGAAAAVDLLFGRGNPSGKLAESWPMRLQDCPSYEYFPGYPRTVEYREGIFVGYRYYDTAMKEVRYPFGFGLSYTKFDYSELVLMKNGMTDKDKLNVSVYVTNNGAMRGAEVVQLYVSNRVSRVFKPEQELKGFERVELDPGETKMVSFELDGRAFAYWNTLVHGWCIDTGAYNIRIGSSSRNIRRDATVQIISTDPHEGPDFSLSAPSYYDITQGMHVTDRDFQAVLGHPMPAHERVAGQPYTVNSTFGEVEETWIGRKLVERIRKGADKAMGDSAYSKRMFESVYADSPLRLLTVYGGKGFSPDRLDGFLDMLNGHFFKGLKAFIKG